MLPTISPRQQHILAQLLEHRDGLSIDALAKALAISRTAVQQHVVGLENDAYIKRRAFNKTAGRPVVIYGITDKGINCFPKQYAWFSELLLSELQQQLGAEDFKAFLQRLAQHLADRYGEQFDGKNLAERQTALLELMNHLGYQVSTDKQPDSPEMQIRASNCIYHDLAQKHPEICAFDVSLIAALLNRTVQQTQCMAKGDCACYFKVQE